MVGTSNLASWDGQWLVVAITTEIRKYNEVYLLSSGIWPQKTDDVTSDCRGVQPFATIQCLQIPVAKWAIKNTLVDWSYGIILPGLLGIVTQRKNSKYKTSEE